MQQEHNRKRIYLMYQMLFAIARGNFSMRIPLSDHDDELEALVVLMNMAVEELKEAVFHLGYINPRQTYGYMAQSMVTLSLDGEMQASNIELRNLLGYTSQELHGQPLKFFLTPATVPLFEQAMIFLSKTDAPHNTLGLEWISKKGLYVKANCTLVKFEETSMIVLSFIIPIIPELQTNPHIDEALLKQRAERQTDAVLIQKIYDYILENIEEPLLSLNALSRKFGTNQFKLKSGFRQFFNTSVYPFYTEERLKRAHLMITQRDIPLKEIALLTGFSTYPNFSKSFKKKYGYNPTDLLQQETVVNFYSTIRIYKFPDLTSIDS